MPSMLDIFFAGDLPSLSECLSSTPELLWLYAGAGTLLAMAFLAMPVALVIWLSQHRSPLPHRDVLYLFAALFFFCGLSFATATLCLWLPLYAMHGWLLATTASVALITVLVVLPKLSEVLTSSAAAQQQRLTEELTYLKARMAQMNSLYEASIGREDRITELKNEVNDELQKQEQPLRYTIVDERR